MVKRIVKRKRYNEIVLALCRFLWVNIIIKNSKCHFPTGTPAERRDPDLSHRPQLKDQTIFLLHKVLKNLAGI